MRGLPSFLRVLKEWVVLVTVINCQASGQRVVNSIDVDEHVEVFGEKTGEPVKEGLLFVDGRYVEGPYRVAWRGASIYVNETRLRRMRIQWPPFRVEVDRDPGMPSGLNRDSRFEDDAGPNPHRNQKLRYLYQHYPREVAKKMMIEYFRALPYVKEVRPFEPDWSTIEIESQSGRKTLFSLPGAISASAMRTPTRDDVIQWLERERKGLEDQLRADMCVFSYENGLTTSVAGQKAAETLPLVVRTLQSDKGIEEKLQVLGLLGIAPPSRPKACESLVRRFTPSQHLADRIGDLRKKFPRALPVPTAEEQESMVRQALSVPGTLEQKRTVFSRLLESKRPILQGAETATQPSR